jgi:hypothetical protein
MCDHRQKHGVDARCAEEGMQVVRLAFVPACVAVTLAWGFLVVCGLELIEGKPRGAIAVHAIKRVLVRNVVFSPAADNWAVRATEWGFDFMALAGDRGKPQAFEDRILLPGQEWGLAFRFRRSLSSRACHDSRCRRRVFQKMMYRPDVMNRLIDSSATERVRMEARQQFAQALNKPDFEENNRWETVMEFLEDALPLENATNVNLAELRIQPPTTHVGEYDGQAG